jgi:hypothetical protein
LKKAASLRSIGKKTGASLAKRFAWWTVFPLLRHRYSGAGSVYAWKRAKWIKAIELVAVDRYLEERGDQVRGDSWTEEPYRDS